MRNALLKFVAGSLAAGCFAVLLTGAAPSRFRGPEMSGSYPAAANLPAQWSDKNVVWKVDLPGHGSSSPAIYEGNIYLTAYTGYGIDEKNPGEQSNLKRHLFCIEASSGKQLWTVEADATTPETKYQGFQALHGYATSTPTVDETGVYVFFGRNGVSKYTHQGKPVWNTSVGEKTHGWGSATSPVLAGDLVIVNASVESGALVGLNKETGAEVWKTPGVKASWNTPIVTSSKEGRSELVVSSKDAILAYDPATGKELWTAEGVHDYVCPSVVSHEAIIYAIGGRKNTALAVSTGGDGEVENVWRASKGSNVSSPVYSDGHIYFVSEGKGIAYCLNAKTGDVVYEERLTPRPGRIYASPTLADGKIFVPSRNEGVYVIAAKPEFELITHNEPLDESVFNASPVPMGNQLLLRSDTALYCIGAK